MPFEPVYENIAVSRQVVNAEEKIKTECRTEIPTESVAKIVNLYAQSVITEKDSAEGKIRYSGKITFFICYENAEGALEKCECGADFSGTLDLPEGCDCRFFMRAEVEKVEADASGVKLAVSGYVAVKADIYACENVPALSRGEGLIVKQEDITAIKSLGIREGSYPLEDETELNFKVAQVIGQSAQVAVTAVQCGVGSIIVDGEVFLSVVMLQSGEKNDIIKENKSLPFRTEIECEEAMPSAKAVARATVRSFKTDIFVDEEAGLSRFTANVLIKCEGEAFVEEGLSIAEDAFAPESVLETERETAVSVKKCEVKSERAHVVQRVAIDELPNGAYIAATCGERAEITSAVKEGDGISVSGVLSLNALALDSDGKPFSRKMEAPFVCNATDGGADERSVYAAVCGCSAKIVSANEAELAFDLIFTVYPESKSEFRFIKDVKAAGDKPVNDHAVSVYLALENEDLWGLAKRLGQYPEALLETNPDLQFPLTGKERIVVYRQK